MASSSHGVLKMNPIDYARIVCRLEALGLIEKRREFVTDMALDGKQVVLLPHQPGYEKPADAPRPHDPGQPERRF